MAARNPARSLPAFAEPPVFVQAVLDEKPWGSRKLSTFGLELPPDVRIGEALFTAPDAIVTSGTDAGVTLSELVRRNPQTWIGGRGLVATHGRHIFPLTIKIIDASQDLSIQVHPSDEFVTRIEPPLGKTEAWHVLAADDASHLYLGLRESADDEAFSRACRDGAGAAAFLRKLPARPGTTYLVPAGTPHAIGAGTVIYEIQQPSTITYRFDDWGRVDTSGKPRQLHIDDGLRVLDRWSRPEAVPHVIVRAAGPRREFLAATRYFALERITYVAGDHWTLDEVQSPHVLTGLQGTLDIETHDWMATLAPWQTLIAPVGRALTLTARQPGTLLRGWVPDLDVDIRQPARAAGIAEPAIAALGVNIGTERRRGE